MRMFSIDTACAGQKLKVEKSGEEWFCILADYGLVSFKIGSEVMFASGKMGSVIFDYIESVDIESQTIILKDYGPVELKHWEYFARI